MTGTRVRKLTELEGVCLGIVGKHEPCTAYRVRLELKRSPSAHWQASAGSLYPLLNRLEAEKIVSTREDKSDGRGRKLLRMTAKGRKSLGEWIAAGVDDALISSVTDPVRSRMFFLDALSAAKQGEYLDRLIALMDSHLLEMTEHQDQVSETGDLYDFLGSLGAIKLAEARLEWLKDVRRRLSSAMKN